MDLNKNIRYNSIEHFISDYKISLKETDELMKETNTDFKVIKGDNQALLSVSDSLILASGTVALEAALYQTPMLIGYKGPWLLYFIYLFKSSYYGKSDEYEIIDLCDKLGFTITNISEIRSRRKYNCYQIKYTDNKNEKLKDILLVEIIYIKW